MNHLIKMKTSKGFTIIELVVVVAIIAVLGTIILVNVVSYMKKGRDAAVKGDLVSLVTRGMAYVDDSSLGNGTYNNFCQSSAGGAPIKTAIESPNIGSTFTCHCNGSADCVTGDNTKWCACSPLETVPGDTFCVDYSGGYKKETGNDCASRCNGTGVCSD